MAKNALHLALFSLLAFLTACNHSPTYKKETAAQTFAQICKKEFKIDVKSWYIGDTLWVYVPLARLLDKDNQFYPENKEHINHMFMVLRRMVLSIDRPPKFYAFVFSDIKERGADLFYIGYVPDLIKIDFNAISLGQWYERSAFSFSLNPKAMNDTEGKHFSRMDITKGDLLSFLVRQSIEAKFSDTKIKEYFKITSTDSYFYEGKLGIIFDIQKVKTPSANEKITLPSPFDEARNAIRRFIKIYDFNDIAEIEINDIANKRQRYYSLPALMESND